MTDHLISSAQASIHAITEIAERNARERDYWRERAKLAESLLSRQRTSLAEQFNDPMRDGTQADNA